MVTLGAVLLARFILGGAEPSRRVLAATLGGPLAVLLPIYGVVAAGQGIVPTEQLTGFVIVLVIAFGTVGWPVAHFATRRLDRLTRFDPQVFE